MDTGRPMRSQIALRRSESTGSVETSSVAFLRLTFVVLMTIFRREKE